MEGGSVLSASAISRQVARSVVLLCRDGHVSTLILLRKQEGAVSLPAMRDEGGAVSGAAGRGKRAFGRCDTWNGQPFLANTISNWAGTC
jgi:hypothetical protein